MANKSAISLFLALLMAVLVIGPVFAVAPERPSEVGITGTLGWWKLNNDATDSSGNGKNGTLTAGTYVSSGLPSVNYSNTYALSTVGLSTGGITAPVFDSVTNNFSVSVWVKWSGGNTKNQTIFYNGNSTANGFGLFTINAASDHLCIVSGGVNYSCTTTTLTSGTWTNLLVVRSDGNWQLYKDGVQLTLSTNPGIITPSGLFTIGRSNGAATQEVFNGVIDEVRLYDHVVDMTSPSVTSFAAQRYTSALSIPITSFTGSDNVGVSKYLITTSSTLPKVDDAGWSSSVPTSYTVASAGNYSLYPWVMDADENISSAFAAAATSAGVNYVPVTVTSNASSPTNSSIVNVTFTFENSVTGFTLSDLVLDNCTSGALSGSGKVYTISIYPDAEGVFQVTLNAAAVTDGIRSNNLTATQWTYDQTPSTTTVYSSASSPTKTSPIPVTIRTSETPVGLTLSDFTITNGTASNLQGSGIDYTIDVTPTANGVVTVILNDGVYTDAAGNPNTGSSLMSITYDTTSPTLTIASSTNSLTNTNPIPFTFTFSESVTGFTADDIVTTNVSAIGFVGSGASYTANITPASEGAVTVNVAAGAAVDAAGNTSAAATGITRTYDNTSPSVVISSSSTTATNTSPIPVTFTFSESVTGFTVGDITVGNGTAGSFTGSGTTYTANITPTGDGAVTVDLAASAAVDSAGNGNTAATQLLRQYDVTSPSLVISSSASAYTKTSPIPVTFTFIENVTDFTVSDITVGNGSASNFAGSGKTYTASITPTAEGAVTVNVAAGAAVDAAGNNSTVATQLSRTYDLTPPTLSFSGPSNGYSKTNSTPLTITFSESVQGFTVDDLQYYTGGIDNFAGSGSVYTMDIRSSWGDGQQYILIAGSDFSDLAGNVGSGYYDYSVIVDTTQNAPTMSSVSTSPTKTSPIVVTIDTHEDGAVGFTSSDLVVTNATISNFANTGGIYKATLLPTADGAITVNIAANKYTDLAGNNNLAAAQYSIRYDTTSPTVSVSSSVSESTTNANPIPVTITFSESVTGFTLGDIDVYNGSADNFAGSGSTYTVDITPFSDGEVKVDIASAAASDGAGNESTASDTFILMYDSSSPTVSISSDVGSITNEIGFIISIYFSEDVSGFTRSDFEIINGRVGFLIGSGSSYIAEIIPSQQGIIYINIAADAVTDTAGNGNTAATELQVTFDSDSPSVTISSTVGNPTNALTLPITIKFSESVSGFTSSDITASSGSVSNFSGSGDTYTADLTPSVVSGTVTLDIAADAAIDAAGNGNTAAAKFSRSYDRTQLTVSVSSSESSPTNANPIPITVTFNKTVTGFSAASITAVNGSVGNFKGSGSTYTADISPVADGDVTVEIAANEVSDAAGNDNQRSNKLSITYDETAPTVAISSSKSSPTKDSPIPLTITFSESVTGFAAGDLSVTNGSVSSFAGSGTTYTMNLTPDSNGDVKVNLNAGKAFDSAGNGNVAASQFLIVYDSSSPTVTINKAAGQADPTNNGPISFTLTFSEKIDPSTLTWSDIGLTSDVTTASETNLTITETPSGNGKVFRLDVDGLSGSGTVTASLPASAVLDLAGNSNLASTSSDNTIVFDDEGPTVTISTTSANPSVFSQIPVSITFSESMTGFTIGDLQVTNATLSNFSGSGAAYTVRLNAVASGEITLDIADDIAMDAAGNGNISAVQFSINYQSDGPEVNIEHAVTQADPTTNDSAIFVITFSQPIVHESLSASDLILGGTAEPTHAAITEIAPNDDTTFEVDVTGIEKQGTVTVSLPADTVENLAGNENSASTSVDNEIYFDDTNPGIVGQAVASVYKGGVTPPTFSITFSEDMLDIAGNTDEDDVDNPENYRLIEFGPNGVLDTISCHDGVAGDDVRIPVSLVAYDPATFTSTVTLAAEGGPGKYTLFLCGSTSIVDQSHNPINNGQDLKYTFEVTKSGKADLPKTGFAVGAITILPPQPTGAIYSQTDMLLSIPQIGVKALIVGVPVGEKGWDVSWLGGKIGYLSGTAFPTWAGNTVLTGHVWNADNTPGVFAGLRKLIYGDRFTINAYGKTYTYEVRESKLILGNGDDSVFKSEKLDWVTLLTCESYNPLMGDYKYHRMVRAVLMDVK